MPPTQMTLDRTLNSYRQFMIAFRHALGVGAPANQDGVELSLPNGRALRFRVPDLYLTHTRRAANGQWQPLVRENYMHMGLQPTTSFNASSIANAIESGALMPCPDLARILFVTAEAARSQLVYQICQRLLGNSSAVTWGDIKPLVNNWGTYTNDNHKRRPIQFGPLRALDYYPGNNKEIDEAFGALRSKGLLQDG